MLFSRSAGTKVDRVTGCDDLPAATREADRANALVDAPTRACAGPDPRSARGSLSFSRGGRLRADASASFAVALAETRASRELKKVRDLPGKPARNWDLRMKAVGRLVLPLGFALGIVFGAVLAAPAGQQATFKASADTVVVYATVQSRDGQVVPRLSSDDFRVLEDGRPTAVVLFSDEPQPITAAVMISVALLGRGLSRVQTA